MSVLDAGRVLVIVTLPDSIDVTNQARACEQLYAGFAFGAAVVVAEFTATTSCDCSSLRAVVAAQDHPAAHGAELRLVIPPGGAVHRLAMLMGVDRVVPVCSCLSEAVAARPVRLLPPSGDSAVPLGGSL